MLPSYSAGAKLMECYKNQLNEAAVTIRNQQIEINQLKENYSRVNLLNAELQFDNEVLNDKLQLALTNASSSTTPTDSNVVMVHHPTMMEDKSIENYLISQSTSVYQTKYYTMKDFSDLEPFNKEKTREGKYKKVCPKIDATEVLDKVPLIKEAVDSIESQETGRKIVTIQKEKAKEIATNTGACTSKYVTLFKAMYQFKLDTSGQPLHDYDIFSTIFLTAYLQYKDDASSSHNTSKYPTRYNKHWITNLNVLISF